MINIVIKEVSKIAQKDDNMEEYIDERHVEFDDSEEKLENDEISPEEEAFVKGYEEASESDKKEEEDDEEI